MTVPSSPVFLGVALRATKFQLGWDLSRLSNFVFAPFFPIRLPDITLLFAIPLSGTVDNQSFQLRLTSIRRERLITSIDVKCGSRGEVSQEFVIRELQSAPQVLSGSKPHVEYATRTIADTDSPFVLLPISCPGFDVVVEPSQVRVDCVQSDTTHLLGKFSIEFLKTPDLTPDEVRDIRRKDRDNVATLRVSCSRCKAAIVLFKSLAENTRGIKTGIPQIAVERLPDEYVCQCGETRFETRFLKLGMHEVFRHLDRDGDEIRLINCYRQTTLSSILAAYRRLINSEPPEELVQSFLTQHPIMWSFLGALAIMPKPRISTHFTPDFAILTPSKTLYFVELEKPQTKLVKNKGGQSAELQLGKDQIDAWRTWVADHRQTVLMELRIGPEQVHEIKYILVAGLESATPPDDLRAVRQGIREDTSFYTFDELAGFVKSIEKTTKDV